MKSTAISIVIAGIIIAGGIILSKNISSSCKTPTAGTTSSDIITTDANNVSVVDGEQIITIKVKGGFSPNKTIAKAGIPTILRFTTDGTFDCSASVRIQSLNIFKVFPQTGTTDVKLGTVKAGTIGGTCGMGMYPFEIDFK